MSVTLQDIFEQQQRIEKMLKSMINRSAPKNEPDRWLSCIEFRKETGKSARKFELIRSNPRYLHLFADHRLLGAKRAFWKINYTQYQITENSIAA